MNRQRDLCLLLLGSTSSDKKYTIDNDPFQCINKILKEKMVENSLSDWLAAEYVDSPTTSSVDSTTSDSRLTHARYMTTIYEKLSEALCELRMPKDIDEYTLLSLKDISIISASFQFFILSGVLPFLEEGVGMSASARSAYIKTWKRFDGDIEAQIRNLSNACRTMFSLANCNEALRNELAKRYICDFICANLQLQHLGIAKLNEEFSSFLKTLPRDLLISSLTSLSKPRRGQQSPQWLVAVLGAHLSSILVEQNGLSHILASYSEMGGENWWDNGPFRICVARQLATAPKSAKSTLAYHSNIFKQFVDILIANENSPLKQKIATLMCIFIDEMKKKSKRNVEIVVFDYFLRFWEVLKEKSSFNKSCEMSRKHITATQVLAILVQCGTYANVFASPRLLMISETLLNVVDNVPTSVECSRIIGHLMCILKFSLANIDNLGSYMYNFITTPSGHIKFATRKQKSSLIEEIGENAENDSGEKVEFDVDVEDMDSGVARRLEHVCSVVKDIAGEKWKKTLLEILSSGVRDWLSTGVGQVEEIGGSRFVAMDDKRDTENHSLHAHLVVGVCFEQLSNDGFEVEDPTQISLLLGVVENILETTRRRLEEFRVQNEQFNVASIQKQQRENIELMLETSKMCVGIVSGVVMAACLYDEIMQSLMSCVAVVRRFSAEALRSSEHFQNIRTIVDDANLLSSLLGKSDVESEVDVEAKMPSSSRSSNVDAIAEILDDAEDVEPMTRGSSLIRASRVFRARNNAAIGRLIEADIYLTAKKLLCDEDSYVFLAAINLICEIVCYDRKYLDDVINTFASLDENLDLKQQEKDIMRRGRMAEALGKVFRELGEISINYLERIVVIFLKVVREDEELTRASGCIALADIIGACRGRGIEKYLDEMLLIVDQLVLVDKSPIVRRAAVSLIRHTIRSCSVDVIQIIGGRLRDLRRRIVSLWRYDADDVVRLHAQLCVEELNASIEELFSEENSRYCRTIKF